MKDLNKDMICIMLLVLSSISGLNETKNPFTFLKISGEPQNGAGNQQISIDDYYFVNIFVSQREVGKAIA